MAMFCQGSLYLIFYPLRVNSCSHEGRLAVAGATMVGEAAAWIAACDPEFDLAKRPASDDVEDVPFFTGADVARPLALLHASRRR